MINVAFETLLQLLPCLGKGQPAEKLCRRPWRLCPIHLQHVGAGLAAIAACIGLGEPLLAVATCVPTSFRDDKSSSYVTLPQSIQVQV